MMSAMPLAGFFLKRIGPLLAIGIPVVEMRLKISSFLICRRVRLWMQWFRTVASEYALPIEGIMELKR